LGLLRDLHVLFAVVAGEGAGGRGVLAGLSAAAAARGQGEGEGERAQRGAETPAVRRGRRRGNLDGHVDSIPEGDRRGRGGRQGGPSTMKASLTLVIRSEGWAPGSAGRLPLPGGQPGVQLGADRLQGR